MNAALMVTTINSCPHYPKFSAVHTILFTWCCSSILLFKPGGNTVGQYSLNGASTKSG